MFTRGLKKVSAITNVLYKSVRYIGIFLWEFDRDSVGSWKKYPLLPGVRYIPFRYRQVWLHTLDSQVSLSSRKFAWSLKKDKKNIP